MDPSTAALYRRVDCVKITIGGVTCRNRAIQTGRQGSRAHLILDARWDAPTLPRTNWPEGPIMDFSSRRTANDELAWLSAGF